uniref:uncharacterized protein LOC117603968 n=1 Tax=Osmia lignaria TaxID=473952 RepID=UPI001479176B|nr:uncharacterized protein LOC117603968 [Osmia lignaria]
MWLKQSTDISIISAIFYLKLMGVWFAVNRAEKYIRNFMVIYSIISLMLVAAFQFRGLYVCWDDPTISTSFVCNIVGLALCFLKFCSVFIQKRKFLQLIEFMQTNFWHSNYGIHEEQLLANVKKICIYFICTFSSLTQFTVICYIFRPAVREYSILTL